MNLTIVSVHVIVNKSFSNIWVGDCVIGDCRAKVYLSNVLFEVNN